VAGDGKVALKGLGVMLAGEEMMVMPATATVDETGAFTLKKVSPAPYELTVPRVPPGAYLKSILWNGREKLGEPLNFSGGVSGDLQVFLGTDGAAFDAESLKRRQARIRCHRRPSSGGCWPAPSGNHAFQSTDDSGHAAFKDVPPGTYLVFAWEKVEQGDWFDPAFVKRPLTTPPVSPSVQRTISTWS